MTLLIGAITLGLILALLALGVYVSFRIFNIPDMTAEGSVTLGASVAAALMVHGYNAVVATAAAAIAGTVAGAVTGLLATKCRINPLLSGILVMTGLYSVNLHVMGRSNLPLLEVKTLATYAEDFGNRLFGRRGGFRRRRLGRERSRRIDALGRPDLRGRHLSRCSICFFRTDMGTAMRATGDSPDMIRALGVSVDRATIFGLAMSNGSSLSAAR